MAPNSPVWTYFRKAKDGRKLHVTCLKCSAAYSNPATSVLYYHLQKKHFINLKKLPSKQQGRSATEENSVSADEQDDVDVVPVTSPNTVAGPQCGAASASSSTSTLATASEISGSNQVQRSNEGSFSSDGPMDRLLSNVASFSRGRHREIMVTDALLFMTTQAKISTLIESKMKQVDRERTERVDESRDFRLGMKDDMPTRSVEREGFRKFVKTLQPLYNNLPSEPLVVKKLEEKYETLKTSMGKKLATAEGLSLTADLMTHKNTMNSFLGMTAHFRDGQNLCCIELGARPMPERKTTVNLKDAMRQICEAWSIRVDSVRAVVTDGGANIKAAVREEFGAEKHVECVAHKINCIGQAVLGLHVSPPLSEQTPQQAVVEAPDDEEEAIDFFDEPEEEAGSAILEIRPLVMKVKAIVRFFRSSEVATSLLISGQIEDGREPHQCLKLVQEVRTRWNTGYYMLDRFLLLEDPVRRTLSKLQYERGATRARQPEFPSPEEIDVLKEVRDHLKPMEEATRIVSQQKTVTLSCVIPLASALRKQTSDFTATHPVTCNLKQKLLTEIDKRFSGLELLRPFAASTILDPRYKQWAFDSPRASAMIISHLSNRISEKVQENARAFDVQCQRRQDTAASAANSAGSLWATIQENIRAKSTGAPDQDRTSAIPAQLKAYLANIPLDPTYNINPLEVWENMRRGQDFVYELAMEYLPIMATSVSAERLFSHAGLISTQLRNRLSPKHVNEYVFLRSVGAKEWFNNTNK